MSTPPVPLAGVLQVRLGRRLLLGLLDRVPVERLLVAELVALHLHLVRGELLGGGRAAVRARAVLHLELRGERDERAGQGVDLVGAQQRAVGEVRLLLRQQPLEAEHEREIAPPLHRRLAAARLDLGQGGVERRAPRGALGEGLRGILSGQHERLARELLGACEQVAGNRRIGEGRGCVSHVRAFWKWEGGRAELSPEGRAVSVQRVPPVVSPLSESRER
jgi:hypothetical protein